MIEDASRSATRDPDSFRHTSSRTGTAYEQLLLEAKFPKSTGLSPGARGEASTKGCHPVDAVSRVCSRGSALSKRHAILNALLFFFSQHRLVVSRQTRV